MSNTLRETNNTNIFRCYIDGKLGDRCKILIDLQNAGQVETIIEKVEKKEGRSAANDMRAILSSQRFTESQREDLREHWGDKKIQFMDKSRELPAEFFRDDIDTPDRAKLLGIIMNQDPKNQAAKYIQYETLLSEAKGDPAKMETLRKTVQTWAPDERARFNREAISRASHEEVVAYIETIDRQMQSSQDERFVEELRQEKKQIFEELAPVEKTRLFKEAALKAVRDGYDTPLEEHQALVAESSPENLELYHGAFQRLIFETSPRNPKDMEEMAQVYSLIPQEARTMYLKTNRQNPKALDHIITIQNTATSKRDTATASLVEKDFENAGMIADYTKIKRGGNAELEGGRIATLPTKPIPHGGPTAPSPAGAAAQREYDEQARREQVANMNEQVRRTVSATALDDVAVNETIKNIKLIEKEKLSPEGRKEFFTNAGSLAKRLYAEGKQDQAVEISKAIYSNIEGSSESEIRASGHTEEHINAQTGKRELWHPQTRTFYVEREDGRFAVGFSGGLPPDMFKTAPQARPAFRGGPVRAQTPSVTQQTAPRPAQQRPQAPQAAGQVESRARGGTTQLNQEALRQAREQSGGGGEVIMSPAVKKVIERPIEQAAQAAVEYAKLNPRERIEALRTAPQKIIEMRDAAPIEAQTQIINDIKSSAAARRFESAQGTQGRVNTLSGMPPQEQKIVLEAVADNPLQLTHLRSAVQQLKPEQQKQFYENVLAEASEPARRQYAQHIRAEKVRAVRENRAGDIERLTREEQVIVSKRPLAQPQAPSSRPTVDGIKPNGKQQAPQPQSAPPPQRPRPETGPARFAQAMPRQTTGQQSAAQTTPASTTPRVAPLAPPLPSSFANTTAPQSGKIVERTGAAVSGETAAPTEGVPVSAIETFKEKLRTARSKEDFETLLKEINAYLDGLQSLKQGQLEQGLAETSFEVQNTDRLITEAELLIEEIKKQLAKFSS